MKPILAAAIVLASLTLVGCGASVPSAATLTANCEKQLAAGAAQVGATPSKADLAKGCRTLLKKYGVKKFDKTFAN